MIPPADFLTSLKPEERTWLDTYTKSFVYKRWQAIQSYRSASQPRAPGPEPAGWHEAAGRYDEAVTAAEQAILDNSQDAPLAKSSLAGLIYDGACSWSRAGDTDRSLKLLRQAIDRGYRDAAWMQKDPDLETLRSREPKSFQALVDTAQKDPTPPVRQ
jgi:tetratricopeptide (TPR) repeat protein